MRVRSYSSHSDHWGNYPRWPRKSCVLVKLFKSDFLSIALEKLWQNYILLYWKRKICRIIIFSILELQRGYIFCSFIHFFYWNSFFITQDQQQQYFALWIFSLVCRIKNVTLLLYVPYPQWQLLWPATQTLTSSPHLPQSSSAYFLRYCFSYNDHGPER